MSAQYQVLPSIGVPRGARPPIFEKNDSTSSSTADSRDPYNQIGSNFFSGRRDEGRRYAVNLGKKIRVDFAPQAFEHGVNFGFLAVFQ